MAIVGNTSAKTALGGCRHFYEGIKKNPNSLELFKIVFHIFIIFSWFDNTKYCNCICIASLRSSM